MQYTSARTRARPPCASAPSPQGPYAADTAFAVTGRARLPPTAASWGGRCAHAARRPSDPDRSAERILPRLRLLHARS
eukprot:366353-Chlamydomonas_euryale.AAC.3